MWIKVSKFLNVKSYLDDSRLGDRSRCIQVLNIFIMPVGVRKIDRIFTLIRVPHPAASNMADDNGDVIFIVHLLCNEKVKL